MKIWRSLKESSKAEEIFNCAYIENYCWLLFEPFGSTRMKWCLMELLEVDFQRRA
ncbi:hypothetical protein HU200_047044 [Digitaria exilis]|uniref:Uncharacterized protein n=1 Tax=Digitaria exilis TaxID=1010633 RepID=A0A835AV25_9POAL|nr:hypothetical protein HU200_047044 [Digitaria exilis]